MEKIYYIQPDELLAAWRNRIEDPKVYWDMIELILEGTYSRLPPWVRKHTSKDDIQQDARLRVFRYSDRFDPARGLLFSYLSGLCFQEYYDRWSKNKRYYRAIQGYSEAIKEKG